MLNTIESPRYFTDEFLKALDESEHMRLSERLRSWGLDTQDFRLRLDRWFTNFDTPEDKRLALKLIESLDYYSPAMFSEMLQRRRQTIDRILHRLGSTWEQVVIVQPDGAADSAHSHAYSLTKEWELPQDRVISPSLITTQARDSVLIIFNDTHGSGNQFYETLWPNLSEHISNVKAVIIAAASISAESHRRFRERTPQLFVVPGVNAKSVLDFSGRDLMHLRELGERIYPGYPLGYGNTGLLVAYHFQCPNNTVPLLWAGDENETMRGDLASPWASLFPYRPKVKSRKVTESERASISVRSSNTIAIPVEEHAALREAVTLLRDARVEHSPVVAKRALVRAASLVTSDPSLKTIERARILHAEIQRELAWECLQREERLKHWERAIEAIRHVETPNFLLQAVDVAIAYVQDPLSDSLQSEKMRLLTHLANRCEAIAREHAEPLKSRALRSRSALLRHRARIMHDPHSKQTRMMLEEARRAALVAAPDQIGPGAVLELGLTEWALARVQRNDRQYADRCRAAEASFRRAMEPSTLEVARFALARFYRMTFRPASSCRLFEQIFEHLGSISRAYLRDAYLYGEAASELARLGWPQSIVTPHLIRAEFVLEGALSAGMRDARTLIALATVRRCLGVKDPETSLEALCGAVKTEAWTEVGALAAERLRRGNDLPSLGLALGLDSGSTWTSLGTYIARFLKDEAMAQRFYTVALTLDPTNVFARTNRARSLLERGELIEAQREISKVPQHADRRFIWWRWVQAEINDRLSGSADRQSVWQSAATPPNRHPQRFADVLPLIDYAFSLKGKIERQRELSSLVDVLATLTPAIVPEGHGRLRVDDYVLEFASSTSTVDQQLTLSVFIDRSVPEYQLSLTAQELRDVARQRVLLDQIVGMRIAQLVDPALTSRVCDG